MARIYGGENGYGYKHDPEGYVRSSFTSIKAGILRSRVRLHADLIPDSIDLSQFAPPVMHQGQTGSCTGHGTSGALYTTFARAGRPLPFVPSPKGIYDVGRCIDRVPNPDGTLPDLEDCGVAPNEALRGITEWGIRPIQSPTSDGRYSDCELSTINNEPTLGDLEKDLDLKIIGEYTIDSTGEDLITDECIALSSGYAICAAVFVDAAFEALNAHGAPLDVPNFDDPDGGNHWIYIIGYRTDPITNKKIFKFRNSWGTGWGKHGDGEATEAFMISARQLVIMSVKEAV